ncbi:Crp/Fnr family transcriptional regulator [Geitlerinema sp. PCC 7407]|uniref:Crp/Fnr family transcriptional regulator n=1 Tax=Geitlerinema sp. PCC 7407 TaxID=1173025 RepID=UPI00029FF443|nr:Crp/Fnr family transcriptional regulator [Geitlerinema sp. PCC 7407]AFY66543.1 putative transcriptional regulator, Crp/Fnr family [Geitlerinema sp. PCC 7407]
MLLSLATTQGAIAPPVRTFARRSNLPLLPNQLWQIHSGVVRTLTWTEAGEVVTLGLWGPGDVLGIPLSSADPLQAECVTEVVARSLQPQDWPQVTDALLRHARQTEELLSMVRSGPVQATLIQVLNWLAQRFGNEHDHGRRIALRITHQELADLVGSTRVTVTKLLSTLERQGFIHRHQRQIVVRPDRTPFWHYEI